MMFRRRVLKVMGLQINLGNKNNPRLRTLGCVIAKGTNDKAWPKKKEAEAESILTSGCAFMIALRLER